MTDRPSTTDRVLAWTLLAAAACACGFFLFHAARAIAFPYPFDYGEGPLLEQGRLLAHGENIYRAHVDRYPFLIANYPPVFPLILAALCAVAGPSYSVARVVTTLAALACALFVAGIVRRVVGGRATLGPLLAAAMFLAFPYVVFWSSLVRIDLVALAFSLGGIYVVARAPAEKRTPLVAAALLALACLTRQSHLLAGPLAAVAALFVARRRAAVELVGALVAILAVAVGSLMLATRGGFFFHVVSANVNAFSWGLLEYFWKNFLTVGAPCFAIVAAYLVVGRKAEWTSGRVLVVAYLVGALVSALTIGKVGSHVNYLLEAAAALAIASGAAFEAVASESARVRVPVRAWAIASLVWVGCYAVLHPENIEAKVDRRAEFAELTQRLRADRGRVLADETMGLLPISGHEILLQPFEFTQLSKQGRWDETPVLSDIQNRRFAMILINDTPATPESWTRERWTARMLAAVHEQYVSSGVLADASIYVPRPTP